MSFRRTSATTKPGKEIQRELGGSGAYVDAIVDHVASESLPRYKPARENKPQREQTDFRRPPPTGQPAALDFAEALPG